MSHPARTFAIAAHGDQKYGEHPYSYHLDAVVEILVPYGEPATTIGYLHDVVEDTTVPLDKIRETFGEHVADCVKLLTDEPGADRAIRKALSHAKLAKVKRKQELALIVKAADRLANLRMGISKPHLSRGMLDRYALEHYAFRKAAYRPGLCDELWQEIDGILKKEYPEMQFLPEAIPAEIDNEQNASVLKYLKNLSAHSDIAEVLGLGCKDLPEAQLYCPDGHAYRYLLAYAKGTVFAFAFNMGGLGVRLPPVLWNAAREDGGRNWDSAGPDWILFSLWDTNVQSPADIQRWIKAAYDFALTPPAS